MLSNYLDRISYGKTGLNIIRPWGLYRRSGSRVLCADGKIRALAHLKDSPDTFFSIPAAIVAGKKYVSGYVTTEEDESGNAAFAFRAHTKTGFVRWPDKFTPEHNALVAKAH